MVMAFSPGPSVALGQLLKGLSFGVFRAVIFPAKILYT